MVMSQLAASLKPDRWKLLLFAGLVLLVLGGSAQSWAFTDGLHPRPPYDDLLGLLPLWPLAVLLLVPLLIVSMPLLPLGIDLSALKTWYGIGAIGAYLYGVACACTAVGRQVRR
jgi:hypothetical protein